MRVAIVGKGNVAYHLAKAVYHSSHQLEHIIVRNMNEINEFLTFLPSARFIIPTDLREFDWDLVILAVSDQAIEQVITQYQFPEKSTIVHVSGATSMGVFQESGIKKYGVFYPLQTFTKSKSLDPKQITFLLESNNEASLNLLQTLATEISPHVKEMNSIERLKVHMAAVIGSNFSNFMYHIAEEILQETGLSLKTIAPLIQEMHTKALEKSPKEAQTGPAIRGDQKTIEKHLSALAEKPDIQKMYAELSSLIPKMMKQ